MMPQQKEPSREEPPAMPQRVFKDPVRSSRSLAIAVVFACAFLIIAAGIVTWLIITPRSPVATVTSQPTDDVRDVKNVALLPPADLPPQYIKNDQSRTGQAQVYYYDDAMNCGFTVGVGVAAEGKTAKDAAVEAVTAAQAQGITTASQNNGDTYELYDAETTDTSYKFESVNLEQDVKVDGVAFAKQSSAILYKQFGGKIALLSYACKAETWGDKKAELATLVSKFTVKAER